MQFLTEIVFTELHQKNKIISYCLLLFWLVKNKHFLNFILRKYIFFIFILKYKYYEPSAPSVFLKAKIFYAWKSPCRRTMKFTVVLQHFVFTGTGHYTICFSLLVRVKSPQLVCMAYGLMMHTWISLLFRGFEGPGSSPSPPPPPPQKK